MEKPLYYTRFLHRAVENWETKAEKHEKALGVTAVLIQRGRENPIFFAILNGGHKE